MQMHGKFERFPFNSVLFGWMEILHGTSYTEVLLCCQDDWFAVLIFRALLLQWKERWCTSQERFEAQGKIRKI